MRIKSDLIEDQVFKLIKLWRDQGIRSMFNLVSSQPVHKSR